MAIGVVRPPIAGLQPEALNLRQTSRVNRLQWAGWLGTGLGLLVWPWAREGVVLGLFWAASLVLHVAMGALFFVALHHASAARWSVVVRRVAEALAAQVPYAAAAFLAVLVASRSFYPWTHEAFEGFKGFWLSWPFFLARSVGYLALWSFFARKLVGLSLRQDRDPSQANTLAGIRWSVAFLPVFALTYWLSSFDWLMSLEPEWASTIFGVYVFAGSFTASLAAIVVLVSWLLRWGPRGNGPLAGLLGEAHLHDLGKLLFAFCTFWAYIWFSQYMLIWYANIPEEAVYYVRRLSGFGEPLFLLNLFLNWVVPALALLPRATKRHPQALRNVALCVLAGHALDVYLMVAPGLEGQVFLPALPILLLPVAAVFLLLVGALRLLQRHPTVCLGDPFLTASLRHRG